METTIQLPLRDLWLLVGAAVFFGFAFSSMVFTFRGLLKARRERFELYKKIADDFKRRQNAQET